MPFGSRARIYPGPAPLAEIVLDELSASRVKRPAGGTVEGSDKALEHGSVETGESEGDIESGDRKLLVAGRPPTILELAVLMDGSVRDELRKTVGKYLQVGVKFVQLDYQP
jgi:hypothetical protein